LFIVWLQDIEQLTNANSNPHVITADGPLRQTVNAYMNKVIKLNTSVMDKVIWLHVVTGHTSMKGMCSAVSGANPTWIQHPDAKVNASEIRMVFKSYTCPHCLLAKTNIIGPTVKEGDYEKYEPGEVISTDPAGKINPPTRQGHVWFFLFKCVRTGYLHIITSKNKDGFLYALKEVINWYKARGWTPKVLRSDNDQVIISSEAQNYLVSVQIVQQNSAPYRQFQNSVERDMQTLIKGVSLLLHAQPWLRADLWDLAAFDWVDCHNKAVNVHNPHKSPSHILNKKPTNLMQMHQFAFGDLVAVGIPKDLRTWKFDLRNDVGIYVGQPAEIVDACYIYWPHSHSVTTRGSVTKLEISDEIYLRYYQKRKEVKEGPLPYGTWEQGVSELLVDYTNDSVLKASEGDSTDHNVTTDFGKQPLAPADTTDRMLLSAPLFNRGDAVPMRTRSFRQPRTDYPEQTMQTRSSIRNTLITSASTSTNQGRNDGISGSSDDVPSFLHEAVQAYAAKITSRRALEGVDHIKWQEAIQTEVIDNMFRKGTLVEEVPKGVRSKDFTLIYSTMQLKLKLKDDGTIDKYKARLCARGDMLAGSVEETYSPSISALAYATTHQIAIIDGMFTCS
jgi:hypothetical protein